MPISFTQRLQDQLDTITANTRELVQPERLAITDQAVQDMLAARLEERILPLGSHAPAFALQDSSTGKPVRSDDLLAVGPLVINFFRGWWCPYCIAELEAWQAAYPRLRERGGLLIAISPLTKRQNDFTVQRHDFTYPLLSDPGNKVAESFGVAYTVPEPMQRHYRSILVNIPFLNGDESWRLPLPATFVISQSGEILFSEAHADYRVRPDPQDVMATLQETEPRIWKNGE